MSSFFKNKIFMAGMLSLAFSLGSVLLRPLANLITDYATRDATPEAQAYATKVTNKLCDRVPGIVADLALTGLTIGATAMVNPAVAGTGAMLVAYDAATNKENSLRRLAKSPYKAYKAYNKYQALNRVTA